MNIAADPCHKPRLQPWLRALASCSADELPACLATLADPRLTWHGPHPIGMLHGLDALDRRFWRPLKLAFPDLDRRDDIVLAGRSTHSSLGEGEWVAATGYFAGTWVRPWLGLPATGRLTFLRYGEFHRIEGGCVAESRVLLDLPDLMRQAGCNPLPPSPGADILVPGPATCAGIHAKSGNPAETAASLKLVEDMVFGSLRRFDGRDCGATNWMRSVRRSGW